MRIRTSVMVLLLVLSAVSVIFGSANAAPWTQDQACTTIGASFLDGIGSHEPAGQTFQPTRSPIGRVAVNIFSSSGAATPMTAKILAGGMGGAVLGSVDFSVPANYGNPGGSWIEVTFSSEIAVTPGATYALDLTDNLASSGIKWNMCADSYAGGAVYTSGVMSPSGLDGTFIVSSGDFSVSVSPTTLSVAQGSSGTVTAIVTSQGGFSSPVTFSSSGAPAGVTINFGTSPVTPLPDGSASSPMVVNVAGSATTGTYPITVTGTSGSVVRSGSLALTVTPSGPVGDFGVVVSPTALSVAQGASNTATAIVSSVSGFSSPVTLSESGAPSGMTITFGTNPITPPPGGSISSTIFIGVAGTVLTGPYTVTVTGTSGLTIRSGSIVVTVTPTGPVGDFSIMLTPSISMDQGSSDTATVTVISASSFSSPVSLSELGAPSGITISFGTNPVTPPPGGSASSMVFISVSGTVTTGLYTVTITGTSGLISRSDDISITVTSSGITGDFVMNLSPALLSIEEGSSDRSTLVVSSFGGFNSPVALSASGTSWGISVHFGTNPVTPSSGLSAYSSVYVTVADGVLDGDYPIQIFGTSGFVIHQISLIVEVTPSGPEDFAFSAASTAMTINQGGTSSVALKVTSINGFSDSVTLGTSGSPFGLGTSFSANPITPTSGGYASSTLTVSAVSSLAAGTYSMTVTASNSGLSHTIILKITVKAVTFPDFTMYATPSTVSMAQGKNLTSVVSVTSQNSFASAVQLSESWFGAAPTGITYTLQTPVTPASGKTATSTLAIFASASASTGSYTLRITGTSASLSHYADITVQVTGGVGDFTITVSPTKLESAQDTTTTATVTVQSTGSFSSPVTITASGMPAGIELTYGSNPITPNIGGAASTTITITIHSTTSATDYPLVITGTGGSQSHSATLTLTVKVMPDFQLSAAPTSISIQQGTSGSASITLTPSEGFSAQVTLTGVWVKTAPPDTSFSLQSTVTPSGGSTSADLAFNAGTHAPTGDYVFRVTATSGDITHTTDVTVSITAAPPPPIDTGLLLGGLIAVLAVAIVVLAAVLIRRRRSKRNAPPSPAK